MSRSCAFLAFGTLVWISWITACSEDPDGVAQSSDPSAQPGPDSGNLDPFRRAPAGAAGSPTSTGPALPTGDTTADPAASAPAPLAGAGGTSPAAGAAGQAPVPAAGSGALPAPPTPEPLRWSTCGTYQCATLEVPLDYAAPSGERIQLAVKRRIARGQQRLGSLLINPGGPGASAIDFLARFADGPGSTLLERFDLVAFDPRGVGQSTPLNCHSTIARLISADPTPDDDAEWTAIDQAATAFADECASKHAKVLPHLATPDVARDMDQLRAALGEEKLSYLGFSYGTELGAWYAELFPDRVRALVLDGALNVQLSALEIAFEQAGGFERSLASYFEWCAAATNNCSWTQGRAAASAFQQLSAAIDRSPLSTRSSDRKVGPGEFLLAVIAPLYSGVQGFRGLSSALTAAVSGDGSSLLTTADAYTERRRDGTYGNIQEANNAVNCLDLPSPPYADLRSEVMRFAGAAPTFGVATLTGLLVCAHWSVRVTKPTPPTAAGAAPILVIGTTGDPATPYAWAQALATTLESGMLLTYEGEGHTAYGRGVGCIDDAVNAYLTSGKLPAQGTRCRGSGAVSASYIAPSMIRLGPMR